MYAFVFDVNEQTFFNSVIIRLLEIDKLNKPIRKKRKEKKTQKSELSYVKTIGDLKPL